MNLVFFDFHSWQDLLPLTYTRPGSELRCGILTISEKWKKRVSATSVSHSTEDYLNQKFPLNLAFDNLLIAGNVLPDPELVLAVNNLNSGYALVKDNFILAIRCSEEQALAFLYDKKWSGKQIKVTSEIDLIKRPYDVFRLNGQEILSDFKLLTEGRQSTAVSSGNRIIGDNVFIEEGASISASILNSETGPIYIDKNAAIMEGCIIRGPLVLNNNAVLKMGAKIYGPTTVGPYCKVGGEVNNAVFLGYSNKGHDGFLGNSVIGEWCNIGADTNTSNLKNNYAEVKLWNYSSNRFEPTGLQFCGLIMGDHSKCGINTMFNTGTVAGVSANIFGSGFMKNFIPSFTWGGSQNLTEFRLDRAFEVAERMMERRNVPFDDQEKEILKSVYELSDSYRMRLK
ncbi:MAG TPA: glucose-1-phosphate thymidylyltransferase [Flavobacteriales bacterium]|jgi:UDP-N-acetylglucosamine diphosphorylase/glucosamine-1-phosphate N-acetyltransferase|nr:glucose-1-phosphate thymidylyltransferase [Flavobacteriales bacterium]